jgi:ABC-2 type transport system ATP-binding protein
MFDEPVNGLDPEGIVWIRTLLRWLASEGRTVFVSSHLMTEMAMTADRLIVVGRGKLIADATVDEFTSRGEHWVSVRSSRQTELGTVLANAGATVKMDGDDQQVRGLTPTEIGDLALGAGIAIYGLVEERATLEEVFFGLTGDSVEYHGMLGNQNGSAA